LPTEGHRSLRHAGTLLGCNLDRRRPPAGPADPGRPHPLQLPRDGRGRDWPPAGVGRAGAQPRWVGAAASPPPEWGCPWSPRSPISVPPAVSGLMIVF